MLTRDEALRLARHYLYDGGTSEEDLAEAFLAIQQRTAERCAEIADTCHDEEIQARYGIFRDAAICVEFALDQQAPGGGK